MSLSSTATVSSGKKRARVSFWLTVAGFLALGCGDFEVNQTDPGLIFTRMLDGLMHLDFGSLRQLGQMTATTIAFALVGVGAAILPGFVLSLGYHLLPIRVLCGFCRSIHELFWGLLFLQLWGPSPITGLLAIAVPFSCIFAKVYAEQMNASGADTYTPDGDRLSRLIYSRVAKSWPAMCHYSRYRFECGLRSATLLGFIGLPTIGYALDASLREMDFDYALALLVVFYLLTASIRLWLRPLLIPVLLVASVYFLSPLATYQGVGLWLFISHDLLPYPLQQGIDIESIKTTLWWLYQLFDDAGFSAIANTLLLTVAATFASAVLCLVLFPLAKKHSLIGRLLGRPLLVLLRATPELMLVFIVLLITGPSMLPAVIALALHNGALLAFLLAKQLDLMPRQKHDIGGINSWAYYSLPQLFGPFLALLFYRAEHILRESAVVGMVGIATLGFYIDSGFEDIQLDVAFIFIVVTALLTLLTDALSRRIQRYIGIVSC